MIHYMIQINGPDKREIAVNAVSKAPDGLIMILKDSTRSLDQNAKFHALCNDASKTMTYMGRVLKTDQWKVLFISGHAIATGIGADMVPGLEGEFVNLRESSSQMGVNRMASLIEYTQAYIDSYEE